MYSEKNSIQDKIRNHPWIVAFVIVQVVFLVILGAVLGRILANDQNRLTGEAYEASRPQLKIDNLAESVEFLDDAEIENIQKTLFDRLKDNNMVVKTDNVVGIVRDGTVKTYEPDGFSMNHLSFIVDLPSLGQSYEIFYEYADEELELENQTSVMCLDDKSEKIYEGSYCREGDDDNIRRGTVAMYLEHAEFGDFTVSMDEARKVITMDVLPNIIVDDAKRSGYIDEVRQVVEDLGVSPEMFEYRVMTPDDYIDNLEPGEIYGG